MEGTYCVERTVQEYCIKAVHTQFSYVFMHVYSYR